MTTLVRLALMLGAVTFAALPAGAQQLYKYTGPDGRVQYTDRPPAGVQNVEKVTGGRVSTVGPSAAAAAGGGEAAKGAPKTAAEREQAFRQRRAESEEKAKKDEKIAAENRDQEERCNAMRRQLAGMQSGARVSRLNEKGETIFLEDNQVQSDIARLQGDIAKFCK
jgi:hypothetical protein